MGTAGKKIRDEMIRELQLVGELKTVIDELHQQSGDLVAKQLEPLVAARKVAVAALVDLSRTYTAEVTKPDEFQAI